MDIIEELKKLSKESKLNVAKELLRSIVPDYEGYQSRITESLRLLNEIPD